VRVWWPEGSAKLVQRGYCQLIDVRVSPSTHCDLLLEKQERFDKLNANGRKKSGGGKFLRTPGRRARVPLTALADQLPSDYEFWPIALSASKGRHAVTSAFSSHLLLPRIARAGPIRLAAFAFGGFLDSGGPIERRGGGFLFRGFGGLLCFCSGCGLRLLRCRHIDVLC
jgi:hypothetical protein